MKSKWTENKSEIKGEWEREAQRKGKNIMKYVTIY